ncbi:MAG: 3-isopropylmalate dehydratase small subunit [Desulfurococcales archaeon]|nr:3-isopropylmalate dehydratase small subunit [Desulfurococcales archaeon]
MPLGRITGYTYILGDNIDTDVIIPGRYLALKKPEALARHALEAIDPGFHEKARKGVIIIAGKNFGMGSSREQAVIALKAAGVKAVVAESFARLFYRNAVNNALPVAECTLDRSTLDNDLLAELDYSEGLLRIPEKGVWVKCKTPTGYARYIIEKGGLLSILRERTTVKP